VTDHFSVSDRLAVVLLCSSLGRRRADVPAQLGPVGWAKLEQALHGAGLTASSVLEMNEAQLREILAIDEAQAARVAGLVRRAGPLSIELERLADRGIWPMSIVDPDYPRRLKSYLGTSAPPVLFGSGDRTLLDRGGLAIVGSRDTAERGLMFARDLAGAAAAGDIGVVSGMARGVDAAAIRGAIDAGGRTVGVIADSLDRRIRERALRDPISSGALTLLTPFAPGAGFSVAFAMNRNKLVYGLADAAVVVSAAHREGGTWAGADEALKLGRIPVFVWAGANERVRHGLQERGARVWHADAPQQIPLADVMAPASLPDPAGDDPARQATLFGEEEPLAPPSSRRGRSSRKVKESRRLS